MIEVKVNKDHKVSNKKIKGIVDYLIIGNSASGLAAAESIRETDKKGRLVVITEEEYTNYSKPLNILSCRESRPGQYIF